jgi:hypothetical protein
VRGGHEVIAMSRGARDPYHASPQWGSVTRVAVDRDAEDEKGTFGARIVALRPDVVIDLICFTAASARQLVDALRTAYGEYGTGKAETEALLHRERLARGVPAVVLHPGHINGLGWPVITPTGRDRGQLPRGR